MKMKKKQFIPGDVFIRTGTKTKKVENESEMRSLMEHSINYQLEGRVSIVEPILEKIQTIGTELDIIIQKSGFKLAEGKPQPTETEPDITTQKDGFKHAARIIKIESSTPVREAILMPKNDSEELDYDLRLNAIKLKTTVGETGYPHSRGMNDFPSGKNSEDCFITWLPKNGTGELKSFHRQEKNGSLYWIETLYENFLFSLKDTVSETLEMYEDKICAYVTNRNITALIFHTEGYLKKLNSKKDWILEFQLRNIRSRTLLLGTPTESLMYNNPYRCIDDTLKISIEFNLQNLASRKEEIIKEILIKIYRKFNFHNPTDFINKSLAPLLSQNIPIKNEIIDGL